MAYYLLTNAAKSNGGAFLIDTTRGRKRKVLRGSFRGVTQAPDGSFWVVSGSRRTQAEKSAVHRIDPRDWSSEKIGDYEVRDSHDLRWFRGHFYLVASVGNVILKLDREGREVDRMQIVEDARDIVHVNCLTEIDGALYCTIFTLTPGERKLKSATGAWHTEGKLLKLDFDNKRFDIVYEPLCQPHSLIPRPEGLYVVESHLSTLSRLDLQRGTCERIRQYRGFLRGLAFTPGEAVLGCCVMYVQDRRRMRPLPWLRQKLEELFPFSGLYVLDDRTWKVRHRVPIEFSEPYELLPLDPSLVTEEIWEKREPRRRRKENAEAALEA